MDQPHNCTLCYFGSKTRSCSSKSERNVVLTPGESTLSGSKRIASVCFVSSGVGNCTPGSNSNVSFSRLSLLVSTRIGANLTKMLVTFENVWFTRQVGNADFPRNT